MEQLKKSLQFYHMNVLKEIAETLRLEPPRTPVRKAWLVRKLSQAIPERAKSPDVIRTLNEAERAMLALLAKSPAPVMKKDVALPLVLSGLVRVEGVTATEDQPEVEDVLLKLMRHGLVINLTEPSGSSSRRRLTPTHKFAIAPEVRRVLPMDVLELPKSQDLSQLADAPQYVSQADAEQFLRRLFFMWAELRREPGRELKAGGLYKRDRRRIAKSMGLDVDEDARFLAWLYALLEALNLLKFEDGYILAQDNDAVKLFWAAKPVTQYHDVLNCYPRIQLDLPVELDLFSQYGYYSRLEPRPVEELRGRVLAALEEFVDVEWVIFPLFMSMLTGERSGGLAIAPNTLRMLQHNWRWYRNQSELEDSLKQADRDAAIALLAELEMLGAVDLGYDAPDGELKALRLSDLARADFADERRPQETVEGQIVLQPDFQLLAMGPVTMSILARLERFAEREKLGESVVSYRITRDSAYRAFQAGETVDDIQSFLEEVTEQPVPQNVLRSLEEWSGQYERIVVRTAVTVVQLDAAATLDRLLEDAELQRYLHRLDEHTAWFPSELTEQFEHRLWELDMLPTYSRGMDADLPRSLRWRDGHLRARHPMPSLYVRGSIQRVAEESDGGWALTPESVQAALATGMDALEIIELVERMTGAELPPAWAKRLKAWSHHYGDGEMAQVTLLHLPNDGVLQELRRADRRLSRWIRPLPNAEGVGVVDERHKDELAALLAEWGIEVETKRWW
jgi:hypothetical protein